MRSSLKDDLNEIAMGSRRKKPSIWAIAGIFAAAIVLGYLLLFTPPDDVLSQTQPNSASSRAKWPMVAYDISAGDLDKMCNGGVDYSKVEDKVVKLCPRGGTVTLKLIAGGKPKPVGLSTAR
jgi:hypothetical protein